MGTIRVSAEDQRHVDAYLEYHALVGATDGGRLLSFEDYEALRAKATAAAATPLRCAWVSVATGLKCRMAGPFSRCMCDHSFREHDVLQLPASDPPQQQEQQEEEANIQVKCKVPGCRCAHYTFIPVQGSADLRCRCKHSYRDHNPTTRQCLKCAASASKGCSPKGPPSMAAQVGGKRKGAPLSSKSSSASGCPEGFSPPIRCACNAAYGLHETRFWFDRQPMLSRGSAGGAVAAVKAPNIIPMGGMTSMLDICEGIDRLALYTDDPQEALRSAQGPNTQTATIHPSSSSSSKKQQQGAVDCLPLLYTPLRLA